MCCEEVMSHNEVMKVIITDCKECDETQFIESAVAVIQVTLSCVSASSRYACATLAWPASATHNGSNAHNVWLPSSR